MASGTSFWKIFLGVLLALVVAGGCVIGACIFIVGKTTLDVSRRMATAEEERRTYVAKVSVDIKKFERSGTGNFGYVGGAVTNGGDRTVTYWKVAAKFYDKKGVIVDTNMTSSLEKLRPGETKSFEMTVRWAPRFAKVAAEVDEVRLE